MKCENYEKNMENCNCTYEPCSRKGICCECLRYHWASKQLPGCLFPDEIEKTWDRSLSNFIKTWQKKGY